MKSKLKAKIAEQAALIEAAKSENRAFTAEEQTSFENLEGDIVALEKTIKAAASAAERAARLAAPVNQPMLDIVPADKTAPKLFKNLVDQLAAVKNMTQTGVTDERILQLQRHDKMYNAPLGANEGSGADGGFAVQADFAGLLMDTAVKESGILNLVDSYQVSDGSNAVKWVDIDESSIASSVFGGVVVYWAAEAASILASNPQILEREMKLEKLMGLAYSTYELDADSSFVNDLYTRAFTTAIRREIESCVISGNGVGKPTGFLNAPGTVSIAKENGQAAATILWENLSKMYHRVLDKANAAWIMHPDDHEQLDFLSFPVGVGGVPVYLPATMAGTLDTLRGKPIYESDNCATLGTVGDVNFCDMSQYMLAYKGGIDAATSIHVQFLTAQNCFRFIFRANGMPKKRSALTIKNSSKTRSSFITLATRA